MHNKYRLLIVVGVVLTLFFVILTDSMVTAQELIDKPPSQLSSSDLKANSAFDMTLTSAITTYLPIILKDFTPCDTIPTLLSPANGGNIDTLIPVYRWNNGNDLNATESDIQVSKDIDFTIDTWSTSSYYRSGVYELQFPWNLTPDTTYYWRVFLKCKNTRGPYSEVWSFTTSSNGTILPAPTLLAPPNGSTVPSTSVTLQWSAVPGAAMYQVVWRKTSAYIYYVMKTNDTQVQLMLSPNTTYEWWVSAQNDYAFGDDSETWTFNTPVGSSSIPAQMWDQRFQIIDGESRVTFVEQSRQR